MMMIMRTKWERKSMEGREGERRRGEGRGAWELQGEYEGTRGRD